MLILTGYTPDGFLGLKLYIFRSIRNRKNIFGKYKKIVGEGLASSHLAFSLNDIQLSDAGQIIDKQWSDIPGQYENVDIDKYVIMPNHIHGILIVNPQRREDARPWEDARPSPTVSDVICSFKSKCTVEYIGLINNISCLSRICLNVLKLLLYLLFWGHHHTYYVHCATFVDAAI